MNAARDWPQVRQRFCRGMDPEKFLADLHDWGWTIDMIVSLERETRERMKAEPMVPIVEHMMDGAIAITAAPREC